MWSWVKSGIYSGKGLELWAKPCPVKLLCTYLMENLGGVGWMLPSYVFWPIEEKAILFASYWSSTKVKFLVKWTASFIIIPKDQETTWQCLQPEKQPRILRISRVSWLIFSLQYFKVQYKVFCLQPASSNCDPADNTRLVYHKAARCKNNYMFFTYKNEVLIHTCSGKRVCPQGT